MSDQIKREIEGVFTRIIEDWGLMCVDEAIECNGLAPCFDTNKVFFVASVRFKGPFKGAYTVACQDSFAKALVLNLLGTEGSSNVDEMEDGVREFANVLAGNIITQCYGEDTVFALEAPQVTRMSAAETEKLFGRIGFTCIADGEPVAVTFSFEGI
jgi:hypothetical protein